MTRQRARTLAAGSVFAGAAALIGTWGAAGPTPAAEARAVADRMPSLAMRPPADPASLAMTLERPLFSPDRRPLPAPDAAADASAVSSPASRLLAVAIGPERSAAVLQLTSGKTSVMMQGEQLDGWILASVSPDGVVLRSGSQEAPLALSAKPQGPVSGRQ